MKNRDSSILKHILEYCDKLQEFTRGMDFEAFDSSDLHKSACALCILQIGELVINLTDEFKEEYSSIPWRKIRSMRNILAHHYGIVDSGIVWSTIQQEIPKLKEFCEERLANPD